MPEIAPQNENGRREAHASLLPVCVKNANAGQAFAHTLSFLQLVIDAGAAVGFPQGLDKIAEGHMTGMLLITEHLFHAAEGRDKDIIVVCIRRTRRAEEDLHADNLGDFPRRASIRRLASARFSALERPSANSLNLNMTIWQIINKTSC